MKTEELTKGLRRIEAGEPFSSVFGCDLPYGASMDINDIPAVPHSFLNAIMPAPAIARMTVRQSLWEILRFWNQKHKVCGDLIAPFGWRFESDAEVRERWKEALV